VSFPIVVVTPSEVEILCLGVGLMDFRRLGLTIAGSEVRLAMVLRGMLRCGQKPDASLNSSESVPSR
jgi:hypothetical protein